MAIWGKLRGGFECDLGWEESMDCCAAPHATPVAVHANIGFWCPVDCYVVSKCPYVVSNPSFSLTIKK